MIEFEPVYDLLTVGEAMVLIAPPENGRIAYGSSVDLGTSGAEANVAITAAMLGLRTAWYSRVGAGPLGQLVLEGIASRGVDVSTVTIDNENPTGVLVKSPHSDGSRVDYYRKGSAAAHIDKSDLDALPAAQIVHTSGVAAALSKSTQQFVHKLFLEFKRCTLKSFDVNYREVLWSSRENAGATLLYLANQASIVFVGRDEAAILWGTSTAEDIREIMPHPPHLVVKDADVEAVEFTDTVTRCPTPPVVVLEPVGAGDAFAAGWLTAFLTGRSAHARLATGHRLAARALQSPTDQPQSIPEEDRVPVGAQIHRSPIGLTTGARDHAITPITS